MTRDSLRWVAFSLTSVLSMIVYKTAWGILGYWFVLFGLAIAAMAFAVMILRHAGARPWPIVGVTAGLIVGQWWLIQFVIVLAFMKFRGFAP